MQCCNNHDEKHGGNHGGGKKIPWMMLLCCLVPMLLAVALISRGVSWGALMILICPLLHIGMIWFMFKGNKKEAPQGE